MNKLSPISHFMFDNDGTAHTAAFIWNYNEYTVSYYVGATDISILQISPIFTIAVDHK